MTSNETSNDSAAVLCCSVSVPAHGNNPSRCVVMREFVKNGKKEYSVHYKNNDTGEYSLGYFSQYIYEAVKIFAERTKKIELDIKSYHFYLSDILMNKGIVDTGRDVRSGRASKSCGGCGGCAGACHTGKR